MRKILTFLSFFTLLLTVPVATFASAQVLIYPGTELHQNAETDLPSPEKYVWEVFQGDEMIQTIKGEEFSYLFSDAGIYQILLTITDSSGETERTHIDVVVGDVKKRNLPLKAVLHTLPAGDESGEVILSPQNPKILFYSEASQGGVVEYRIDQDIHVDSDGDGNPANDVDNKFHKSFQDGSVFPLEYADTSVSPVARLTVLSREGNSSTADVVIRFLETPKEGSLSAKIASIPPAGVSGERKGKIFLYNDEADVIFSFAGSKGNIVQYWFDKNILVDSDGDGDPARDIDNINHPSFVTGEPLQVRFLKSDGVEQTVQFIAVSAEGKGSVVQRKIIFDEGGAPLWIEPKQEMNPELLVDQTEIEVGKPVEFHIIGTPPGTKYSWDFNGDGQEDASGTEVKMTHTYQEPGQYVVEVTSILGDIEQSVDHIITVIKEEILFSPPTSSFNTEKQDNNVHFVNLSAPDKKMEDQTLLYQWDFGDGNTSSEKNPEHKYIKAGEYEVLLTVTDSMGTTSKQSEPVTILAEDVAPEQAGSSLAEFEIKKEGNSISFFPLSAQEGADSESLVETYQWDFGDGNTSSEVSPNHTYSQAGDYEVLLMVTDALGKTSEFTTPVHVAEEDVAASPSEEEGSLVNLPLAPDEKSFSWWKILFFLPLFLLGGVLLLLFFRKVESPDLGFGEIVREEMEKWMEKTGKVKNIEKDEFGEGNIGSNSEKKEEKPTIESSPFAGIKQEDAEEKKADSDIFQKIAQEDSDISSSPEKLIEKKQPSIVADNPSLNERENIPDWLKTPEKQEGEKASQEIPESNKVIPSPSLDSKENLPEWLKPGPVQDAKEVTPKENPTPDRIKETPPPVTPQGITPEQKPSPSLPPQSAPSPVQKSTPPPVPKAVSPVAQEGRDASVQKSTPPFVSSENKQGVPPRNTPPKKPSPSLPPQSETKKVVQKPKEDRFRKPQKAPRKNPKDTFIPSGAPRLASQQPQNPHKNRTQKSNISPSPLEKRETRTKNNPQIQIQKDSPSGSTLSVQKKMNPQESISGNVHISSNTTPASISPEKEIKSDHAHENVQEKQKNITGEVILPIPPDLPSQKNTE